MIITIKAVAPLSGETRLCDGPGRGLDRAVGPIGLGFSEQRNIGMRQPIRAKSATPLDRGCARLTIEFSVSRECASLAAANAWTFNHRRLCVRAGTLYIVQDTLTETYPNAVLTIKSCQAVGVSVQTSYSIVAAGLET